MSQPESVVLLSGGMDSCVTAAVAAARGPFAALHLDYGQRTAARERRAFEAIAARLGAAAALALTVPEFPALGGTTLTDAGRPIEGAGPAPDAIPATYVPFRNAILLSFGVAWAEALGAAAVYLGAVEEDSSGYPDCRASFVQAFQEAVRRGTQPAARIRLETPVIHAGKAEIVRLGLALGAPLELTWSCYVRSDLACGVCDSCRLRRRAFAAAGAADPIPYVPGV